MSRTMTACLHSQSPGTTTTPDPAAEGRDHAAVSVARRWAAWGRWERLQVAILHRATVTWGSLACAVACTALTAFPTPMGDGVASYLKADYPAAIASCRAALAANLSDTDKASCWYLIGQSFILSGDMIKAREAFSTIVNDFPKTEWCPHAHVGIGDTHYRQKCYTEAIRSYLAADTKDYIDQHGPSLYYRLCMTYRAMNDSDKARSYEQLLRTKYPQSLETAKLPATSVAAATHAATPATATKYYVQVSTAPTTTRAKQLVAELKRKGLAASYEAYRPGTPNAYCVLVGPYTTKQAADAMTTKIKRSGYAGAYPITKPGN